MNTGQFTSLLSKSDIDPIVKKFFKDKPNLKKRVKNRFGNPLWLESRSFDNDDGELVLIPVVDNEHTETETILIAFQKNGKRNFKFKILERQNLDDYQPADQVSNLSQELSFEYVLTQFLLFDHNIFGEVDCNLVKLLQEKDSSKGCSPWIVITETHWDIYVNGVHAYSDVTQSISYEWICNDSELLPGEGGSPSTETSYGPGGGGNGSTGSTTDNNVDCPDGHERDENGECVEWPIMAPDCEAFQWSKKPVGRSVIQISCIENLEITFAYYQIYPNQEIGSVHTETGTYTLQWTLPVYFELPGSYSYDQASILASNAIEAANAALQVNNLFNPDDTDWDSFVAAMQKEAESGIREYLEPIGGRLSRNNNYGISRCNEYETIPAIVAVWKCPEFPEIDN